jgi:hypothetical protein
VDLVIGIEGKVGAKVYTRISFAQRARAGIVYNRNAGVKMVEEFTLSHDFTKPTINGYAWARPFIKMAPGMLVYGLEGPDLFMRGYLKLKGETKTPVFGDEACSTGVFASLHGGMDAGFEWKLKTLKKVLGDWTKYLELSVDLYKKEWLLRKWNVAGDCVQPPFLEVQGPDITRTVQYASGEILSGQYTLKNSGEQPLAWEIDFIQDSAVSVTDRSGSLDKDETTTITVTIDTGKLSKGTYRNTLHFKNLYDAGLIAGHASGTTSRQIRIAVSNGSQLPPISGISTWNWDLASGEACYFNKNNEYCNMTLDANVKQFWIDHASYKTGFHGFTDQLCQTLFRANRIVTSGYAYDAGYYNLIGKYHAGMDIDAGLKTEDTVSVGTRIGQIHSYSGGEHLHLEVQTANDIAWWGNNSQRPTILASTISPMQAYYEYLYGIQSSPGSGQCRVYVAPDVWKEFDCYNLAAIGKNTNDDPFTPSWRLIKGYWQWGRKGPDPSQWYDTNTEHFAHGPTGPGDSEANETDYWLRLLYKTALEEQAHLCQAFEQVQADRSESPMYAARFEEIVDFTRGVADKIYDNPEDQMAYFNDFVTHLLDFKDLYTSGQWDQVLHHWVMMNIRSGKGDPAFIDRLDAVLARMGQDDILAALTEKAVPLLVEKGKDDLLPAIADHLETRPDVRTSLTGSVKNVLASVKILTGQKAPNLVFHAPVRTQTGTSAKDILIETDKLDAAHTILLFSSHIIGSVCQGHTRHRVFPGTRPGLHRHIRIFRLGTVCP